MEIFLSCLCLLIASVLTVNVNAKLKDKARFREIAHCSLLFLTGSRTTTWRFATAAGRTRQTFTAERYADFHVVCPARIFVSAHVYAHSVTCPGVCLLADRESR